MSPRLLESVMSPYSKLQLLQTTEGAVTYNNNITWNSHLWLFDIPSTAGYPHPGRFTFCTYYTGLHQQGSHSLCIANTPTLRSYKYRALKKVPGCIVCQYSTFLWYFVNSFGLTVELVIVLEFNCRYETKPFCDSWYLNTECETVCSGFMGFKCNPSFLLVGHIGQSDIRKS